MCEYTCFHHKSAPFRHFEIKPDFSLLLEICLTFLKEKSSSAHLSCQLCPSNAKLFAESVEKGDTSAAGRALLTHIVKLLSSETNTARQQVSAGGDIQSSRAVAQFLLYPKLLGLWCTLHTHRMEQHTLFRLRQGRKVWGEEICWSRLEVSTA